MLEIITAVGNFIPGKGYPIGRNGELPWQNVNDLRWFRSMTKGQVVIMGSRTYDSIGKALPDRVNMVISRQSREDASVEWYTTLEDAIESTKKNHPDKKHFLIGGGFMYKYALDKDLVDVIHIDYLNENVEDADTFFPEFEKGTKWQDDGCTIEIEKSKAYAVTYRRMQNKNTLDEKYLGLVKDTLEHGSVKHTRAGDTRSVFGRQLRIDLKEGFPLLTTKKMFYRGMIHELLWFLKGDTNIKYLVDNNVHIWDDDAYRYFLELISKDPNHNRYLTKDEFMEKVKNSNETIWVIDPTNTRLINYIPYRYGDLGPVYGKQWRNWDGKVDQIKTVIEKLRNNPDDRRLLVSAWNAGRLAEMALPPCHYAFQFYTRLLTLEERIAIAEKRGTKVYENIELLDEWHIPTRGLSCMFNMRSCDCGLGVPINIASYALLTHMIAQCVNMEPDELIFNGGDFHIYENHIEALTEQLSRNPKRYSLPKLELSPEKKEIDEFTFEDIKIVGYESYPTIKMPLSVGL